MNVELTDHEYLLLSCAMARYEQVLRKAKHKQHDADDKDLAAVLHARQADVGALRDRLAQIAQRCDTERYCDEEDPETRTRCRKHPEHLGDHANPRRLGGWTDSVESLARNEVGEPPRVGAVIAPAFRETFGEAVKRLHEASGWSLHYVAEAARCTEDEVLAIEERGVVTSRELITALADVFDVEPGYLYDLAGYAPDPPHKNQQRVCVHCCREYDALPRFKYCGDLDAKIPHEWGNRARVPCPFAPPQEDPDGALVYRPNCVYHAGHRGKHSSTRAYLRGTTWTHQP